MLRMALKFHCLDNSTDHAIHILHHLIVPEADHFVATGFQVFSAFCIVFNLLQMLTSIKLDDQFLARSAEIDNIVANGVLISKMNTFQSMSSKSCPQFDFCR